MIAIFGLVVFIWGMIGTRVPKQGDFMRA
jgi:hypothetical protein